MPSSRSEGDFLERLVRAQKRASEATDRVLADVRLERARQNHKWGWGRNERDAAETDPLGHAHDDSHLPGDWTRFLVRHLGRAEQHNEDRNYLEWRDQMVKVAALAVAAIESYDRQREALRDAE